MTTNQLLLHYNQIPQTATKQNKKKNLLMHFSINISLSRLEVDLVIYILIFDSVLET